MKKFWLVIITLLLIANLGFSESSYNYGSGATIRVIVSLEACEPVFYLAQGNTLGSSDGVDKQVKADISQEDLSLTFYIKLGAFGDTSGKAAIRADASKVYHLKIVGHSLKNNSGEGTSDPTLNIDEGKNFSTDITTADLKKKISVELDKEATKDNKVCIDVIFNGETISIGNNKMNLAHWDFLWAKNNELRADTYLGNVTLTIATE